MNKNIWKILLFTTLAAAIALPAFGEGLSHEQGDAIINELRQIRQMLEKQQKPAPQPSAPAAPERVKLKIGKEFALGKSDAPLVMVEYTDFQCPFCNRFHTGTFPDLKKQYIDTGKMRFISRNYPLSFHPHAMKAAQATFCAGDQGKFWQLKDALMTNSAKMSPELITSLARDASLDMDAFQACMDGGKHDAEIKEGIAAAEAVGINGTPSFVLGRMNGEYLEGYKIVGAQPFASFDAVAKELLAGEKK